MLRLMGSISAVGLLLAAMPEVCPAQFFQPDTTNTAATVEYLAGQVSILRDSQAWALNIGAAIKPQQVILTGPDGYAKFKVSDGSTFEVFPNSRVTFRNTPGDWTHLLDMLLGRVKVHIEKLNGMPNHNRITTPTAIISVRGTTFDVQMEEADTTLVSVDEGMVEVRYLGSLGAGFPVRGPVTGVRYYVKGRGAIFNMDVRDAVRIIGDGVTPGISREYEYTGKVYGKAKVPAPRKPAPVAPAPLPDTMEAVTEVAASKDPDLEPDKPFACPFCDRPYKTKQGREKHVQLAHPEEYSEWSRKQSRS